MATHLGFGTQPKVYKLQVVVFINQQVLLQFRETSIAEDIKNKHAATDKQTYFAIVSLMCHILRVTLSHSFNGCFYWFEVSMCVSLAVDVGHRRHNLSEKHPGLLL